MMEKKQLTYTIGTVCKVLNINEATLRLYDRKGLIRSRKDERGYRYYTFQDFHTLSLIRHYRNMDLSMEEIRELLYNKSVEQQLQLMRDYAEEKERFIARQKQILELMSYDVHMINEVLHHDRQYEIIELKSFSFLDLVQYQENKDLDTEQILHVTEQIPSAFPGSRLKINEIRENVPVRIGYIVFDTEKIEDFSDYILYPAQKYIRCLVRIDQTSMDISSFYNSVEPGLKYLEENGYKLVNDLIGFKITSEMFAEEFTDYNWIYYPVEQLDSEQKSGF